MLTTQQELDLYATIMTEDEYAPIAQKMLELNEQIKANDYSKIAVPTTDILLELLLEMQQQK